MPTDAIDFAQLHLDAAHVEYVLDGCWVRNPRGPDELLLGRLVLVFDRDGWATCHRVVAEAQRATDAAARLAAVSADG